MGTAEHDPSRRDGVGTWAVESREAAPARAPEFGPRYFQVIFDEFAERAGARFPRWSEPPGDRYALFDRPEGGAGFQVDLDLESIIVWGVDGQVDYGDWGFDQAPPSVDLLQRLIRRDRGGTGAILSRV